MPQITRRELSGVRETHPGWNGLSPVRGMQGHNSRSLVGLSLFASAGAFETELGHGSVGGVEFAV